MQASNDYVAWLVLPFVNLAAMSNEVNQYDTFCLDEFIADSIVTLSQFVNDPLRGS